MRVLLLPTQQRRRAIIGRLPPGAAGTRATLVMMQRLAREGARDPAVIEAARDILRRAGVRGHDVLGEVRALFTFARDRVRYTRDPVGVELLQTPARTLRTLVGDCDDKSTLLAALLHAVGHPAQLLFRAVAANPSRPGMYSHVYVVANVAGRRVPLDPTPPDAPMGWQVSGISGAMEVLA